DKRPNNTGSNSANSNPYVNLKGLIDKSTNNYNIYSGKVATNCVGYTAMVAAMARSLNIPTRIVNGVHITEENWNTATNNLNVADHHRAECYVNDKWISVDANMGNQNHCNGTYTKSSGWTKTGLSNYSYFDATADALSTNYIVKAVYVYDEELANNPTTVELSKTSYIYDGKAKKPVVTVKNGAGADFAKSSYTVTYSNNVSVGTATVTVKFKAPYSGTIKKSFKINPKATTVSSLTSQCKGFTVKWAKQATQTTGYQIQYSTSSSFTNAKTATVKSNSTVSKNVTGLTAKKKYYVRIRTYKTVNGTSYYSSWSASKNVTTSSYPTTISLSATSLTYNGKARKPSVTVKHLGTKINSKYYTVSYSNGRKNVGTYTVTIKFKAPYSGTVKKSFTITPKATTLSSVTAASKAFTVKWKKQKTQTTGYQIQYSISSDFSNPKTVTVSKNSTTSKKITKLTTKRKYYVRVRTYKVVGKTKVCSAWSKAKTVTTKK
ncbi:MAG: fibronectin type III domain-containing protein, partial [Eubacterium sp.]|nr:fibronectin type III domain-containing protein [Eubacterium sp.]